MKIKYLILAAAITIITGCATSREALTYKGIEDLSTYREVVLTVHGLSCPLCSNNLDGQLRRIKGVTQAAIDLKTGAVTVMLDEGHSVSGSDLNSAVYDAGFTLKKIEPKNNGL